MKYFTFRGLVFIFVLFTGGCEHSEKDSALDSDLLNSVNDLNLNPVIGDLGIPLGEVAKIKATVIDGDTMRMKEYEGILLLRITAVNDEEIKSQPVMKFADILGMPMEEIDQMWIGKSISLEAYEAGEFSGIPTNIPDHWPAWAAPSFGLRTHLNILSWPD